MDDIEQRGGVGEESIIQTYTDLVENDPWVLAAVQELTKVALECGFWELDSLDETHCPPIPHKNHPIWGIIQTKRAELSEEEAIWQRPVWMSADDGLPCVRWIPNYRLAFAAADGGPSSSVPSDVNSDGFDEEELRGRRQTPRSQPAASVSIAHREYDTHGEAEGDKDDKNVKDEDIGAAERVEGTGSDDNQSKSKSKGMDSDSKQMEDIEVAVQAGHQ